MCAVEKLRPSSRVMLQKLLDVMQSANTAACEESDLPKEYASTASVYGHAANAAADIIRVELHVEFWDAFPIVNGMDTWFNDLMKKIDEMLIDPEQPDACDDDM